MDSTGGSRFGRMGLLRRSEVALPSGVVLDEPLARALMFKAVEEGLMDGDPAVGDGFVRRLMSTRPNNALVDQAFEQLVLGGRVYVPFWLPPDWKGPLVDQGVVSPMANFSTEELLEVDALPPDLVLGMLESRNLRWGRSDLEAKYHGYQEAYSKWDEVADGKSFDGLEIRMALKNMFPIQEDEYSSVQLEAWHEVQARYRELRPVLDCVDAFRRVLTASANMSALSSIPVTSIGSLPEEARTAQRFEGQGVMLRIACRELRRVPIASCLRDTLDIAGSSEAEAMRGQLARWSEALRDGALDPAMVVLPEVERARRAISTSKSMAQAGEYITWVGVPVAVAGLFLAGPVVAGAGLAVSAAGGVLLASQKVVERLNRWAMFAQS